MERRIDSENAYQACQAVAPRIPSDDVDGLASDLLSCSAATMSGVIIRPSLRAKVSSFRIFRRLFAAGYAASHQSALWTDSCRQLATRLRASPPQLQVNFMKKYFLIRDSGGSHFA